MTHFKMVWGGIFLHLHVDQQTQHLDQSIDLVLDQDISNNPLAQQRHHHNHWQ